MKRVSAVYHSGYGHTTNQAMGLVTGIETVENVTANRIAIDQDGEITGPDWQEPDASDATIFASPTYMDRASWQFKKLTGATSTRWFNQGWKGKIAAGFTYSALINGDKQCTLQYFMTLAMQHSMRYLGIGLMPSDTKVARRDDINSLRALGGLTARSPSDAGADEAPTFGDIQTVKAFGIRIEMTFSIR